MKLWTECGEKHAQRSTYDTKTRTLRCRDCGHRVSYNGERVIATRYLPKMWLSELPARRRARRV